MATTHAQPATFVDTIRHTDPARLGYTLLHTIFAVAPILFGLDKFFNLMTFWPGYLAHWIDNIVPGSAQTDMYIVGVIEIIAGLLVWFRPRIGAWIVCLWLLGIIVNLLTYSGFYDVALRDFGLLVSALALAVMTRTYDRPAHAEVRAETQDSQVQSHE